MNYQNLYEKLIENAKARDNLSGSGYERHHIVMKSMGGTDDAINIVRLTYREHYLAHWLLYKIHRNRESAFAWRAMSLRLNGRSNTSRLYERCKLAWSLHMSELNRGVPKSESARRKMSEAKKGRDPWNKGVRNGRPIEDLKSEYEEDPHNCYRCGGAIPFSVPQNTMFCSDKCKKSKPDKPKILHPNNGKFYKGMVVKGETRKKISDKLRGIKRPVGECPHCSKVGAISLLKRWHFDNCKVKDGHYSD